MDGDEEGRLRCDSVWFVRDGARVFGDLVHVPCVCRTLRVRYDLYVLMCLVSILICLRRSVRRHLRWSPLLHMGARRASCAIVHRCAMYGIELKVYTSFVHERSCSCVACTCKIDKGPFVCGRYARM